jgi:hypothetical protein
VKVDKNSPEPLIEDREVLLTSFDCKIALSLTRIAGYGDKLSFQNCPLWNIEIVPIASDPSVLLYELSKV